MPQGNDTDLKNARNITRILHLTQPLSPFLLVNVPLVILMTHSAYRGLIVFSNLSFQMQPLSNLKKAHAWDQLQDENTLLFHSYTGIKHIHIQTQMKAQKNISILPLQFLPVITFNLVYLHFGNQCTYQGQLNHQGASQRK